MGEPKKEVVVFGNPKSILIKDLISKISEINPLSIQLKSLYEKGLINFILFEREKILIWLTKQNINTIHFHYLSFRAVLFISYIFKYKDFRIIVSLWGSDLNSDMKGFKKLFLSSLLFVFDFQSLDTVLKAVKTYTYANKAFLKEFQNTWPNLRNHSTFTECRWGSELLSLQPSYFKSEKIRVTIGYNGRKIQQHEQILKVLCLLPQEIKDKLFLIIPFSYGGTDEYKNLIEMRALETGIKYDFVRTFLDKDQLASLRCNSEIFIQLQQTDQFSASMLEYGYFGNIIITGSWLPYQELRDIDTFLSVERIDHLIIKLSEILDNIDEYRIKAGHNSILFKKLLSWDKLIIDWCKLYE